MFLSRHWTQLLVAAVSVFAVNVQSAPRPIDDYDDIDVIVAGRYPSVAWVAPVANSVFIAPISASNAITLQASAGSRKLTITKLEFVYRKDCVSCAETALPVAALQTGTNKSGLYQYVWNNAVAGSYLVRAKATDSGGGVSFAGPVTISVDTAPTVAITSPANNAVVTAPASFALTTNAADTDAGGSISKVEFFKSATVFNTSTIIGTVTAAPWNLTWSNVAAGTYTVVARATDNLGVVTTSAPITLFSNVAPTVTLTSPTNNATYTAPATVSLSATATDSDGTIGNVSFYKSATLFDPSTLITSVNTGVAGVFSTSWTAVPVGSYTVTARATDNRGAIVTSGSANITVCGAPTVTLTSPTANQKIDVVSGGNTPVSLSATTSTLPASCGTISKIEYYSGTTLVATSTASPFSTTWNGVVAGSYSIKARAYVGAATTGTDSVANSLIVNNKPTVTMSQPTTNTFVAAPATIAFAATAADVGGTINRVEFLNGTTIVNSDTTSPYAYSWTGVAAGVYSLSARAFDNLNASTTSTAATVTVCAAPTVVLNQPTNGQVVTVANQTATATVALAATVTTPYAGCIGKVEYYNGTTLIATATAAPWSANWTNVATATYAIKARVYTIGSTTSYTESAPATFYVNKPPVVTLTTPSTTQAGLTSLSSITLSATATDTDPNVQSVAFYNGTTLIGTVNTGQAAGTGQPAQSGSVYNYVWTPSVGNYSISAVATDGRLATVQTAANALSVCGTPTITLATTTAQPIVLPANSGVLEATVTQPNTNAKCGTITQVEFFRTGTAPAINTDTAAPYSYTVSGLVVGTTNYTAKVTDSAGRTASTVTSVPLTVVNNIVPTVYISTPAAATNITYSPTNAYTVTAKANDTDNGISSIQLRNNGVNLDSTPLVTTDGTACTFTPVTPGLERSCSAAIPAGTPVGMQSITAVANDGTTSTTSAAVVVTIQPAPIVCTLSAVTPVSGATTTVFANCKSGGSNLAGVTIAWTGTCTTSTTSTDASGNASCATPALTVPTSYAYSINATKANYSAVSTPAANISISPVANVAPKIAITGTSIVAGQVVVNTQSSDTQTLTLTGQLSNGTTLTNNNGVLTGAVPPTAGMYTITVTANDGFSTTTAQSTVAVHAVAAADDVGDGTATNVNVGLIGGNFGVAEGGAATYSIPILTPPGIAGVQPNLALGYSSQGGYGMLGVGWSLSGLGSITRCPRTVAQDLYRQAINYNDDPSDDAYCYGGQRLVPVGARSAAGTGTSTLQITDALGNVSTATTTESADRQEFRTEIDSLSRITGYYGYSNVRHGVSRFEVETKDGRVLHFSRRWKPLSNGYEICPDVLNVLTCHREQAGNLVKFYVLDRMEDRSGNTMEIDYAGANVADWTTLQPAGAVAAMSFASASYPPTEIYPTQIRYTSNTVAQTGAFARVDFAYATLPPAAQVRSFDAGAGESILTKQLTTISIYEANTLQKTYQLTYLNSVNSGRALLDNVRECYGSAATTCLPATQLAWQGAMFTGFAGSNSGDYSYTFPSGTNLADVQFKDAKVADIYGNGRSAWLRTMFYGYLNPTTQAGTIMVCDLNASNTVNCTPQYFQDTTGSTTTKKNVFWADMNGDGRADLVVQLLNSNFNNTGDVLVCLANSDGTGFGATPASRTPCSKVNRTGWLGDSPVLQGDFNGDGRIDFAVYRGARPRDVNGHLTTVYFDVYMTDANGQIGATALQMDFPPSEADIAADDIKSKDQFVVADFNGDGLADIMQVVGTGKVRTCLSRISTGNVWSLNCPQDKTIAIAASGIPLPNSGAWFTCSIAANQLTSGSTKVFTVSGYPTASGVYNAVGILPEVAPCATLSSYEVIVNPDGQTSATSGTVACASNLSLTVGAPPDPLLLVNQATSYSISVTNNGASTYSQPLKVQQFVPWNFQTTGFAIPSGAQCTKTEAAAATAAATPVGVGNTLQDLQLVDLNGDGLADLLAPVDLNTVRNTGLWNVCLSTGDGAFARYRATGDVQSTCSTHALVKAKSENVVLGDFDGDGRTDILAYGDTDAVAQLGQNAWRVCFGRGADATSTYATESIGFDCRNFVWNKPLFLPARDHVKSGDFNGDGLTDISYAPTDTSIRLGTPAGIKQDLVTRITTGLGATTDITYAPLTDSTVYSKGTQGAMAPNEVLVQSPMYVVKRVDADNGVDTVNKFSTTYSYEGLKGTTNGRGMLGFNKRTVNDLTGGFTSVSTYNNSVAQWQIAGRPISVVKTHPNALESSKRLNQTDATYHIRSRTVGTGLVFDVFSNTSTASSWDLNGTALPTTTTTTLLTDYDAYGNVAKSTVTTSDGFTKITENTYGNWKTDPAVGSLNRGDWIIGRVLTAKATHQKTGSADVVRNSSFTYYGVDAGCSGAPKGFLCQETLEPDLESITAEQFPGIPALAGNPKYLLWQQTKHAYDVYGNRTSSTVSYKDLAGNGQTRSSGSNTFSQGSGRYVGTISNALGHSETRTYKNGFGLVSTQIGPNGFLTLSEYDSFGRKRRERSFDSGTTSGNIVSDASWLYQGCNETDTTYGTAANCQGNEIYRTRKRVSAGPTSIVFYDRLQRELRVKSQAFGDNTWAESTVTYDVKGRKTSSTRPSGTATATTNWYYDDLNRVKQETLTGGALTHTTDYGFTGLTTTVTHRATSSEIAAGMADQTNARTVNSQGQVTTVIDALSNSTGYVYDAVGNLTQVNAPGGLTESMRFDGRGRKLQLTTSTAGTHSYAFTGLGELVKQTDGRGWDSVMSYDALGRMTQRTEYRSSAVTALNPLITSWVYDAPTAGNTCGANGPSGSPATIGKLCEVASSINGAANTRSMSRYDALGRLEQSRTDLDRSTPATADGKDGPQTFISTVLYDANSRVIASGAPSGVILRNVYKAWGGALTSVTDNAGTNTHWQATARNLDGQISSMSVGGLTTNKAYDGLGRLDTIITGAAGAVQNLNVDFDIFGNLKARSDSASGLAFETFKYDAINRLTHKGTTATSFLTSLAAYDAVGNLTSKLGQGSYNYGGTTRLQSFNGLSYVYDGNGNVTSDGLRSIQYNSFNLPDWINKGGTQLNYSYDGNHARVKETSPTHGSTYYLGGYELVIPADSSAANPKREERTYINTPEGTVGVITQTRVGNPVGAATQSTDTRYWHKDHLGSISAITSSSGTVVQRFRFDPWGARECLNLVTLAAQACSSASLQNGGSEERGFTGHEMLDEVGLIHMNGRLFDQNLGRFLQADPIIQEPLNSQNYNRYSYVLNNPLAYTDPTGFSFWTKVRKPLAAVAIMIVANIYGGQFAAAAADEAAAVAEAASGAAAGSSAYASAYSSVMMASNVAGGFAAGGITGGTIESAVLGAFQAMASGAIGDITGHGTLSMSSPEYYQNVLAHAALGCGMSAAQGGSCKSGAMAAGFSAAAGPIIANLTEGNFGAGLAGRMAAGCVGSYIGKGSCEAGAVTAAFDYLYNAAAGQLAANQAGASIKESAAIARHIAEGADVLQHVGITVKNAAGETFQVISDYVAIYRDRIVIGEVKNGLGARLSGGQLQMFDAALNGRGSLSVTTAANRDAIAKAGAGILESRLGVTIEAMSGSRALRNFGRIGLVGVAGAFSVLASPLVMGMTWANDLGHGTLPNNCAQPCTIK